MAHFAQLDETNTYADSYQWNLPVPYPTFDNFYIWDKETPNWQQVEKYYVN